MRAILKVTNSGYVNICILMPHKMAAATLTVELISI